MGWHPASSRSGGRLRPGTRGGASGGTPVPGESAEGHLQGAGPVDSVQEWVGIQPALDLAEGFVQVLAAARQEERLCQERARKATSKALAQLIPCRNGLASSQLSIWRKASSRYSRRPVRRNACARRERGRPPPRRWPS